MENLKPNIFRFPLSVFRSQKFSVLELFFDL